MTLGSDLTGLGNEQAHRISHFLWNPVCFFTYLRLFLFGRLGLDRPRLL